MPNVMHLILKYNYGYNGHNVDPIEEHKKVINEKGQVIWGILRRTTSTKIGKQKIETVNNQINIGVDTYGFMYSKNIRFKSNIKKYLTREEVLNMKEYVPSYYLNDLESQCVGGVILDSIECQEADILEYMVQFDNPSVKAIATNQSNPIYVAIRDDYNWSDTQDYINERVDRSEQDLSSSDLNETIEYIQDVSGLIEFIYKYINSKGFIYSKEDLANFYLSLKTKPFVILAGISGTGKSRLVRLFAEAIGSNMNNNKLSIIPVRPDWSDNTELIGYKNIVGDFIPGKLTEVIEKASRDLGRPYFVCLDEMNLARVEYYLSDYLSIVESREFEDETIVTDNIFSKGYVDNSKYKDIILPENLYLIGTVNMDDTTHAFSRKVLDRANTIELSNVELDIPQFMDVELEKKFVHNDLLKSRFLNLKDAIGQDKDYVIKVNELIKKLNSILSFANKQFGYRVRDEIVFYMIENNEAKLLSEEEAMDYQIMQKILPTIAGSDYRIKKVLIDLFNLCSPNNQISDNRGYIEDALNYSSSAIYKKSARKIVDMLRELEDGFTSYWV